MSEKLQPARGTKDLSPDDFKIFQYVTGVARNVSARYGFSEIATPIFEFTDVFKRTLGEESDVVGKEMYTFEDRGGESVTLRPEFTAGIARAFISGGLGNQLPLKLFTTGPLFRYERPQKGRQRQFHQVNCEILGAETPNSDVEIIAMGWQILEELGITDSIKLEINSLGDQQSRDNYRTALVKYFSKYKNELSDDSKVRLEKNPLRILDSKDEGDKKIVKNAPLMADFYSDEAKSFFEKVQNGLTGLGIKYEVNPHLVRGLDYYCHTAFEFTTNALGAQNTVLAGGRYDGLIAQMGGAPTPAIGFAGGVERIMALFDKKIESEQAVALIPIGEQAEEFAAKLAYDLRKQGFNIELAFNGNVKKRMKKAGDKNVRLAVIFGDDELKSGKVKIKDFASSTEREVEIKNIAREI